MLESMPVGTGCIMLLSQLNRDETNHAGLQALLSGWVSPG